MKWNRSPTEDTNANIKDKHQVEQSHTIKQHIVSAKWHNNSKFQFSEASEIKCLSKQARRNMYMSKQVKHQ